VKLSSKTKTYRFGGVVSRWVREAGRCIDITAVFLM
jgi:hypothetical protein